MKKFIVPLLSVAFYFLVYVAIVLLKPVHHDNIRTIYLSTHTLVQSLADVLALHGLSPSTAPPQLNDSLHQLQQNPYQHHPNAIPATTLPTSQKMLQNDPSPTQPHHPSPPNQPPSQLHNHSHSHIFACPLRDLVPQAKLAALENSITHKLGLVRKDKSRNEALYHLFDGLLTHFALLSSNFSADTPLHSYLPQIYDKEEHGNNLMFLYESTAAAINKVLSANNISIFHPTHQAAVAAANTLNNLKIQLQNLTFGSYKTYWKSLYTHEQILTEYRNQSAIFLSQQTQSCSILTNSHLKALALVLQTEHRQTHTITTQQFVELATFFEAATRSLEIYYGQKRETVKLQHMKSWLDFSEVYYFVVGLGCVVVYMFSQINIEKKVKRQFRHAFPPGNKFKLDD